MLSGNKKGVMKSIRVLFGSIIIIVHCIACSNGVYFGPASVQSDGSVNTEVDPVAPPPLEGTGVLGTGNNTFSYTLESSTNPFPDNCSYTPLQGIYTSISDTTGDGFTIDYTLTVNIPKFEDLLPPNQIEEDTSVGENVLLDGSESPVESEGEDESSANPYAEGDQNIRVTLSEFIEVEGNKDYFSASFVGGDDYGQTFTFTPEKSIATLRINYNESRTTRRGTLPILFEYQTEVYSSLMPLKMVVYSYSKGTFEPETITLTSFTETDDSVGIFEMPSSGTAKNYNVTIQNRDKATAENTDYSIDFALNFLGVLEEAPLKVTVKDANGVSLGSSSIVSNYTTGTAKISLNLKHTGIEYFDKTNGTITIVVDDTVSQEIYKNFPMTIVLNTEREESFEHYAQEYVNKFTASQYSQNLKDEKGYYTQISLPAFDPASDATLNYRVHRKDLSSDSWKVATEGSFNANTVLQDVRDYNALKLDTSDPIYKLEIIHGETSKISGEKTGSRMLTDRELFLYAVNSIRNGLNDGGLHDMPLADWIWSDVHESFASDTFKHKRTYNSGKVAYNHYYILLNYKRYDMTINGSFQYSADHYRNRTDTTKGDYNNPFTGTVSFTSPYGSNGSFTFNNVEGTSGDGDDWRYIAWSSGSITLNVDGRTTIFNKENMAFDFYDDWGNFRNYIAPNGMYTQQ